MAVDPAEFCSQSRLVIVAGKGGVGKTTVSLALARMAAGAGLSALVIEIEGKGELSSVSGSGSPELRYHEEVLVPGDGGAADVRARTITPDDALLEYLADRGMRKVSRRLVRTGALDIAATAAPGIKDILVLGKVKQLERARAADLIVLDAPAAGHAVTFLMSPRGLLDAVRVGPIRDQATEVLELLGDPDRCRVLLVTIPEETPVNEVVETAYSLEDRVGVKLGPVVVNGVYPPLEGLDADPDELAARAGVALEPPDRESLQAAAAFRRHRQQLQEEQVRRLAEALPLPQLRLPFLFRPELALAEVDVLAGALVRELAQLAPRVA